MTNKARNYGFIKTLTEGRLQNWTKVRMDNIVLPDLRACRLLNAILAQVVKTKEQPNGCNYSSNEFRVVLRLLDGKVFLDDNKRLPDAYCWKHVKVEAACAVKTIGYKTPEAARASEALLSRLATAEDQRLVKEMLELINADFLLVTTEEENRQVIEVTQDLYNAGLDCVVDEWMTLDENGCASETELDVGDFIVVTADGYYCIRRNEFLVTHKPM